MSTRRTTNIIVILFIGGLIILFAIFVLLLSLGRGQRMRVTETTSTTVPRVCGLTGEAVRGGINPVPFAVAVDNIEQARPQSGLDRADIVYEVSAEAGIPRFLAIYSCQQADRIGPVRSARTYFVSLARQFDAVLVHAGGSPEALEEIDRGQVRSLDQATHQGAYFRSRERRAPHNLFTSTSRLINAAQAEGFDEPTNPEGPPFGTEEIAGEDASSITVRFPTTTVSYRYDAGADRYFRRMNDDPHRDALTGDQLSARNVIVQFAEHSEPGERGRIDIELTGSGRALFFMGGKRVEGSWSRTFETQQFRYEDATGEELRLQPGQTWVEIVREDARVSSES